MFEALFSNSNKNIKLMSPLCYHSFRACQRSILKKIKKFQNILTQNGDRPKNESPNILDDAISVPIRRSLRPVQKRKSTPISGDCSTYAELIGHFEKSRGNRTFQPPRYAHGLIARMLHVRRLAQKGKRNRAALVLLGFPNKRCYGRGRRASSENVCYNRRRPTVKARRFRRSLY